MNRATHVALGALVPACVATTGCQSPVGNGATGGAGNSVLELFAPPSPVEAVEMATNQFDPDARQKGVLLLSNAYFGGERVYVEMYRLAAEDEDAAVRSAGLRALGVHGEPEDGAVAAELLESDPDRLVRWEAARTLQRLHAPDTVTALVDATQNANEDEPEVRAAAAIALGQHARRPVLDALVAALDDRDLAVNMGARRSLRMLTGQRFGDEPAEWLAWIEATPDPFAEQRPYRYPVFERDERWWEWLNPFSQVPNEVKAPPVGLDAPVSGTPARPDDRE